MLVLADIGALPPELRERLQTYVHDGGLLLRFAGPRLAAAAERRPRRRCGCAGAAARSAARCPGRAPRTLAPFDRASPFYGLTLPKDVGGHPPASGRARRRPVRARPGPRWPTARRSSPPSGADRGSWCSCTSRPTRPGRTCRSPACSWRCCADRGAGRHGRRAGRTSGRRRRGRGLAAAHARRVRRVPHSARDGPARSRSDGDARRAARPSAGVLRPPEAPLAVNTLAPDAVLGPLDLAALWAPASSRWCAARRSTCGPG